MCRPCQIDTLFVVRLARTVGVVSALFVFAADLTALLRRETLATALPLRTGAPDLGLEEP